MTRYIDADLLVEKLNIENVPYRRDVGLCIEDTPTADVVEVVRCKDCRHSSKVGKSSRADGFDRMCNWFKVWVDNEHFCSHGEMRE